MPMARIQFPLELSVPRPQFEVGPERIANGQMTAQGAGRQAFFGDRVGLTRTLCRRK